MAAAAANMAAPASADRRGRCAFLVTKKKRFCKMLVAEGRIFCGEHADKEEGNGGERMLCPLDPKHTVDRDKLDKHLKKCNSRQKAKPAYYVENINAGPEEQNETQNQGSLCERSAAELQDLLDKLDAAVSKALPHEPEERFLSHPVFHEEFNNPKNGASARKHLKQQASILGHLEALGLLRRGRCFVEFGAGRGKLSHWIGRALENSDGPERPQMLLVERSAARFKADGKQRDAGADLARLRIDIRHLDLSKVAATERRPPLVGVGKHLCGAATDLALRCLFPTPAGESVPVLGLAVALCCHHRCEWRHYAGRSFFSEMGLSAADFADFCRMSGWATCGRRADGEHEAEDETDAPPGFLSTAERERIGRRCKLLIDRGRLEFLRGRGFRGRLTRYVDAGVTPENVLLTATPAASPS
ncbi:tRNA:m(4)X modification enzyme TRM13 homolog isoform X2 [Corythoichthys intestinalis]|uniref:tRNA:m(4)X modification enzyme TRM13 homolog isoform X2 n=1 Tax=Corythoichthys intestinalis TaxID=161448 RepID=UPI0025A68F4D|nr:tRNA:m(4)X modification enzyme TRM13 homolog isoform X2 [Corythoichthys intestinalis]